MVTLQNTLETLPKRNCFFRDVSVGFYDVTCRLTPHKQGNSDVVTFFIEKNNIVTPAGFKPATFRTGI